VICGAAAVTIPACGALVHFVAPPRPAPIAQGSTLLWAFAIAAAFNVVTLAPVHRAMLAGPLRVFAAGRELPRLLVAHTAATVVLFARLEAIALLGVLLHFLAGRRDWFWGFAGVALLGMLALWPTPARVRAHLGLGAAD